MKKRILSILLLVTLLITCTACTVQDIVDKIPIISLGGNGGDDGFVPSEITQSNVNTFTASYAEQLNPNEKAIYDEIVKLEDAPGTKAVVLNLPERVELCKGRTPTQEEQNAVGQTIVAWISNALTVVRLENPWLFWLDTGYSSYSATTAQDEDGVVYMQTITVKLQSTEDCAGLEQYYHDSLKEAAEAVPVDAWLTDAQKVAVISEYLCDRVTYDAAETTKHKATAVGALVKGKALCEGYAQAFTLLCQMHDIDVTGVVGLGVNSDGSENHMWNAVKLNGIWYAVDVTWNDGKNIARDAYLLVGSQSEYLDMTFAQSHIAFPQDAPDLKFERNWAYPTISLTAYSQK